MTLSKAAAASGSTDVEENSVKATVNVINPDASLLRKAAVRKLYIESARDIEMGEHIRALVENAKACLAGAGLKQRALFLLGESNSGKSRTLEYHFACTPEFQPYRNEFGETVVPLLTIEAPSPCSTKSFAIALLAAIGIQASDRLSEYALYTMLKRQLRRHGILFVCVDEMQHVMRGSSGAAIQKVQDVLKSLMQIDGWPLHAIFSGTPSLKRFLEGDKQLSNRSRVMRFYALSERKTKHLRFLDSAIAQVLQACEVNADWKTDDELPGRLLRAAAGSFGGVIQMLHEACFRALDRGRRQVTIADFADVYRLNTGCMKRDNIFTSSQWREISPRNAIADMGLGDEGDAS